jgi:hypothetical protein
MSIKHQVVPIQDLTKEDLAIIQRGIIAAKADPDKIARDFLAGKMITIRASSEDETAIFLFQESQNAAGEIEWFCIMLSTLGKVDHEGGKYLHELSDPIEALAKSQGVKRFRAMQIPKLYEYITEPLGWKINRYEITKEL